MVILPVNNVLPMKNGIVLIKDLSDEISKWT